MENEITVNVINTAKNIQINFLLLCPNKLCDSRLTIFTSWGKNKKHIARTRKTLAIFDPIALPTAIEEPPSKVEIIEIKISGDDVAKPIKTKLETKGEKLDFSVNFSTPRTKE
tara:strand:- start:3277 stop:3615 length:339 start_codon:yes stop_codon:yes gene_type:complete